MTSDNMDDAPTTKRCSKCGRDLPLDLVHWYRCSGTRTGWRQPCRDCTNIRRRARRRANPNKRPAKAPAQTQRDHAEQELLGESIDTLYTGLTLADLRDNPGAERDWEERCIRRAKSRRQNGGDG